MVTVKVLRSSLPVLLVVSFLPAFPLILHPYGFLRSSSLFPTEPFGLE